MSYAVYNLISNIIGLYMFVIFAMVVSSWLLSFNIINMRNPVVAQIVTILHAITEPVLAPIRRILPSVGGLDFAPVILLFGLMFLQDFISSAAMGRVL